MLHSMQIRYKTKLFDLLDVFEEFTGHHFHSSGFGRLVCDITST